MTINADGMQMGSDGPDFGRNAGDLTSGAARGGCPGVPELCEHSQSLLSQVLEGMPDPARVDAARHELGHCLPCVSRIDLQMRYKAAMLEQSIETAPLSLQLRISDTLRRIDLGEIDVNDL
jgi:hypothetical protein